MIENVQVTGRAARRHRGAGLPLAARAPDRRGHRRHRAALRPPPPDHALLRGRAADRRGVHACRC
ncbi:MAG: hypothetical protein MZV70_22005 [Desulfobacterales bacterium]|nr:hypothetical protein [Desulfobacterales bacterium]